MAAMDESFLIKTDFVIDINQFRLSSSKLYKWHQITQRNTFSFHFK